MLAAKLSYAKTKQKGLPKKIGKSVSTVSLYPALVIRPRPQHCPGTTNRVESTEPAEHGEDGRTHLTAQHVQLVLGDLDGIADDREGVDYGVFAATHKLKVWQHHSVEKLQNQGVLIVIIIIIIIIKFY